MDTLLNISPIDGRYSKNTEILRDIFSEYGFIKYRIFVEIHYLLFLADNTNLFNLTDKDKEIIMDIITKFDVEEANKVKIIENKINHDVKAIEFYIKIKLDELKNVIDPDLINQIKIYVHFCLTSQDINCPANMLMVKDTNDFLLEFIGNIMFNLEIMINKWTDIIIISKTHGQIASPTSLGKELMVFYERLENQVNGLKNIKYRSKFGGAVGNFNAHKYANKEDCFYCGNWNEFGNDFLKSIGLGRNQFTTQIDHYDNYGEIFNNIQRINTILIDLCQDIWLYISNDIFKLKIDKNEVGSSTMPHKVNPINFENAEGNFLLANTLLQFMSNKLPVSRLQRDLTDSTILRNVGTAYGYVFIALKSLEKGLNKLDVNKDKLEKDLNSIENHVLVGEGIQSRLKYLGILDSYEKIKDITRNNISDRKVLKNELKNYIDSLNIAEKEKQYLNELVPMNYTGIF